MKYRIYQNGNGLYLIKRQKFFFCFWQHLKYNVYRDYKWDGEGEYQLFGNKEAIVEFLNKEERQRIETHNAKIHTLITTIDVNKIPPLCSNCKKEIEEIIL